MLWGRMGLLWCWTDSTPLTPSCRSAVVVDWQRPHDQRVGLILAWHERIIHDVGCRESIKGLNAGTTVSTLSHVVVTNMLPVVCLQTALLTDRLFRVDPWYCRPPCSTLPACTDCMYCTACMLFFKGSLTAIAAISFFFFYKIKKSTSAYTWPSTPVSVSTAHQSATVIYILLSVILCRVDYICFSPIVILHSVCITIL